MTTLQIYLRTDTNLGLYSFYRSPITEKNPTYATIADGYVLVTPDTVEGNPMGVTGVKSAHNEIMRLSGGDSAWFCSDIGALIDAGIIIINKA